jgi:hypothetical protein
MKNLITLIIILFSNLSSGQIKKAGDFYELNKLWKRDSVAIKKLISNFDLDISKLDTVQFFHQFNLNKELHDNYSRNSYMYKLDKNTGRVRMEHYYTEKKKPAINKYVMIVCFDALDGDKTITIKVF